MPSRRSLLRSVGLLCSGSWARELVASEEDQLASLINSYRKERGLSAVPVSRSLSLVARIHALDLETNTRPAGCNMHSWSSAGPWTPCCYTSDHAQAQCMWTKPREVSEQRYRADGFEIAFGADGGVTALGALSSWKTSPTHHAVIINQGAWARFNWRALGVAVSDHYALAWFGEQEDSAQTS